MNQLLVITTKNTHIAENSHHAVGRELVAPRPSTSWTHEGFQYGWPHDHQPLGPTKYFNMDGPTTRNLVDPRNTSIRVDPRKGKKLSIS